MIHNTKNKFTHNIISTKEIDPGIKHGLFFKINSEEAIASIALKNNDPELYVDLGDKNKNARQASYIENINNIFSKRKIEELTENELTTVLMLRESLKHYLLDNSNNQEEPRILKVLWINILMEALYQGMDMIHLKKTMRGIGNKLSFTTRP